MTIEVAADNAGPVTMTEPTPPDNGPTNPADCWAGGKRQAGGHIFSWIWERDAKGATVWTDKAKCGSCGAIIIRRRQDENSGN